MSQAVPWLGFWDVLDATSTSPGPAPAPDLRTTFPGTPDCDNRLFEAPTHTGATHLPGALKNCAAKRVHRERRTDDNH